MRKNQIFLLLLIFSTHLLNAQTVEVDAVYLNTGSILKGTLLEAPNDQSVKIETPCGIWVFPSEDVDSIRQITQKVSRPSIPSGFSFGWHTAFIPLKSNHYESSAVRCNLMLNYMMDKNLELSAGMGTLLFDDALITTLGEIKYVFRKWPLTPYLFGQYAYVLPKSNSNGFNEGGSVFNAGIGIKRMKTNNFGYAFRISYYRHSISENYRDHWWGENTVERTYITDRVQFGLVLLLY